MHHLLLHLGMFTLTFYFSETFFELGA